MMLVQLSFCKQDLKISLLSYHSTFKLINMFLDVNVILIFNQLWVIFFAVFFLFGQLLKFSIKSGLEHGWWKAILGWIFINVIESTWRYIIVTNITEGVPLSLNWGIGSRSRLELLNLWQTLQLWWKRWEILNLRLVITVIIFINAFLLVHGFLHILWRLKICTSGLIIWSKELSFPVIINAQYRWW